ncbi:uncharacterized protein BDZ83DRAFT_751599 [Colletotrichum acutatum]|uniref:Uncharacterized protein n=1 Tax=Glomerella acutata TaxID=27357 RepID=A0AAD8UNW5_GLOAC|nr:uncharacterized protein BDZ83DRAFT_751599 [Colletotrichum acutatum]KAK1725555.1 hypothetical protein BDZ83DRAFT_751599 [Colletotrichum acutatum]
MTRTSFDDSSKPAPVSQQHLKSAVEKLTAEAKVQEPSTARNIQKSSLPDRGPEARPAERGKYWIIVGSVNAKRRQVNAQRVAKDGVNAVLMTLIDTHTCLDIKPFPATREDFWSIDESETRRLAKALDIATEGRPTYRIMHDLFEIIMGPLPFS